jgi:hypothetical protein
MGGVKEARRIFGGADALVALLDSLNAALFGDDRPAPSCDKPTAHDGPGV